MCSSARRHLGLVLPLTVACCSFLWGNGKSDEDAAELIINIHGGSVFKVFGSPWIVSFANKPLDNTALQELIPYLTKTKDFGALDLSFTRVTDVGLKGLAKLP